MQRNFILNLIHFRSIISVILFKGGGERGSLASVEKVRGACMFALVEGDEECVKVIVTACLYALTTHLNAAGCGMNVYHLMSVIPSLMGDAGRDSSSNKQT